MLLSIYIGSSGPFVHLRTTYYMQAASSTRWSIHWLNVDWSSREKRKEKDVRLARLCIPSLAEAAFKRINKYMYVRTHMTSKHTSRCVCIYDNVRSTSDSYFIFQIKILQGTMRITSQQATLAPHTLSMSTPLSNPRSREQSASTIVE